MATEDILEAEIARRTAQGWEIVSRGATEVQMRRPKRFSFGWALLWFLVFGVGVFVYLVWHWLKAEQLAYLRVVDGKLVVSQRLGLLGWLLSPVRGYWRWAGSRQTTQAKALAYGGPIASVVVLIIVIAVATSGGGGGDEDGQPAAQAQPSPTAPTGAGLAATPSKPERIVDATPGAVAEAENVRLTLLEVMDPWTDYGQFGAPEPGTRYVAISVAVENLGDRDHDLSSTNFHLKTSSFDGEVTFFKVEPDLFAAGPFLDLSQGAKAQGWVTFVVAQGAELKILKYDPDIFTTNDIEFHFQ